PLQVLTYRTPSRPKAICRAWPRLSANTVAQKPGGSVMPPLSPAQRSACAFAVAAFCDDCAKLAGAAATSGSAKTNKEAATGRITRALWRMRQTARSFMTILQMYAFNLSSEDGERRRVFNRDI